MKLAKRAPMGAAVMLVSLAAGLGVAACGSSSNTASSKNASSTSSSKSASTGRAAFEACLKQHGVTLPSGRAGGGFAGGTRTGTTGNFTPPTGTTGHFTPRTGTSGNFTPPNGGAPGAGGARFFGAGNSKSAKAFKACASKLGKSGFAGGFGRGRYRGGTPPTGATGTTHFSDATLKSFVACVRRNGYAAMPEANSDGKFPKSVETNSKFEQASRKCYGILFHPTSGTSTTSTST